MGSEFCNQNTYDCIQIHGGSGFMKDYRCERLYRDARITSIYEGTTQLQVVAAIRHVTTGTYLNFIKESLQGEVAEKYASCKAMLEDMAAQYEAAVAAVLEAKDQAYTDFMARRLVEMAGHTIMGCLLLDEASRCDAFDKSLEVYVNYGKAECAKHADFIANFKVEEMQAYSF